MKGKKVVLCGCEERVDAYSYLKKDINNTYSILFSKKSKNRSLKSSDFIVSKYYQEDYLTSQKLLNHIKPDVIVFFEIFDFYQIAIAIAAKKKGIKTIFLDHGAVTSSRNYIKNNTLKLKKITLNKWKSILFRIPSIIKSRIFYFATLPFISKKSLVNYLTLPHFIYRYTNAKALNLNPFPEKDAGAYILFNKNNYIHYNYLYHITPSNVFYSGIPTFDFLRKGDEHEHIIYIDSPYFELNLFGWDKNHHHKVAVALNNFSEKTKRMIYVKLHPLSDINIWNSYNLKSAYIKIIQFENYESLYANARMILGYSSSMIPGFLSARKNVVLLGWFPIDKEIKGLEDLSSMNICHLSLEIDDLNTKYSLWERENKAKKNTRAYKEFLNKYNFPFDGKATERIIKKFSE